MKQLLSIPSLNGTKLPCALRVTKVEVGHHPDSRVRQLVISVAGQKPVLLAMDRTAARALARVMAANNW